LYNNEDRTYINERTSTTTCSVYTRRTSVFAGSLEWTEITMVSYLQDHLSALRAQWFNYYEACLEESRDKAAERALKHYEMFRSLRNKVYHLNGRDTLALGYHEQRWWDQQHDY
jgi:hypothetical protein